MAAAGDATAELVRQADPDRYLAALYAPREARANLLALYAFNAEVAAVRDRVSEPLPGEMRLQWWRDVIEAESGPEAAQGHPTARALLETVQACRLPRTALLDHLEARIFDLYDDPMPDRTALEGYCGETAGALIQLSALVLDAEAARDSGALAGHAGCAQAIAGLLRLLPLHRARGQCYVPADILAAVGTDRDALVAGTGEGPARAVAAMAALGREHLTAFERAAADLPQSLRPAFLPLAPVGAYLRRIAADPAGALVRPAGIAPLARHWLVLRAAMRGWPSARR